MKLGVLGAGGFVGSAIHRASLASSRIDEMRAYTRHDFNLADVDSWGEQLVGLDCVVNAAVQIDGPTYEVYAANALFTHELALHLNRHGIAKFINLSTGAIYGKIGDPTTPSFPCRPEGDYAISKYLGERLLTEFYDGHLNHLRIYYPYGPGQTPPRFVPRLIDSIAAGQEVTCDARGGPYLSMSHVEDVAALILDHFVLETVDASVCNIASPHRVPVLDIANEIGRLLNVTPKVSRQDGSAVDVVSVPYDRWRWRPFALADCVAARSDVAAAGTQTS